VAALSDVQRLIDENERFAAQFDGSSLSPAPRAGLAIITCMDARIAVEAALGLGLGDAHVIRNAGGFATGDAIRSLVVSQQVLGTRAVLVIAHTRCGLLGADDHELRQRIETSTGVPTDMEFGAFADLEAMVREQVATLRAEPAILDVPVHGLIYDVDTGRLRRIT
jgi:carbonic anhydrase